MKGGRRQRERVVTKEGGKVEGKEGGTECLASKLLVTFCNSVKLYYNLLNLENSFEDIQSGFG